MRLSQLLGKRLKEKPSDALIASHTFLIRGGYARQTARGIYLLLPPARRITRKIEAIIREEMDRIGGQEVLLPIVIPAELWDESGRQGSVGPERIRLKDRTGHGFILGMAHEDAVVQLCRSEVESYKQLPFMIYQIQEQFRDEARPRGGLVCAREFTMKDAYSFHATQKDLDDYYEACKTAYRRIFTRAGIPETAIVESDAGMMGGNTAHEFVLLCDAGEDVIVSCPHCGYLADLDAATGRIEGFAEEPHALEEVETPGQQTIEGLANYLGVPTRKTLKVVFYDRDDSDRLVLAAIRGDREINEAKLARVIRREPVLAEHDRLVSVGVVPGFASLLDVNPDRCRIVVDHSVAGSNNLVCGANKVDWHLRNFNLAREVPGCQTVDIARVREGDGCPHCPNPLGVQRGIEVAKTLQLGAESSTAMGMSYLDKDGNAQAPIMGCYRIGVGRLLASVMEARRDDFGPIWPMSIAPWHVHIVAIGMENRDVAEAAEAIHDDLGAAGIETVWDDRNERAGVQFADADLLGVPLRITVGAKSLAQGGVELARRGERRGQIVPRNEVPALVRQRIQEDLQGLNSAADGQ